MYAFVISVRFGFVHLLGERKNVQEVCRMLCPGCNIVWSGVIRRKYTIFKTLMGETVFFATCFCCL